MISLPFLTILLTITVIFVASSVRATVGFGDALIAMPLLVLFLPLRVATPAFSIVATFVGIGILITSWRAVSLAATWRLIAGALLGIPLGLLLLTQMPEQLTKSILGVILAGYALYNLFERPLPTLKTTTFAYFFGFASGILGGAYNTAGPPLIVYGTLRRWSPDAFRANLQAFFLPVGLLTTLGHALSGLWNAEVLTLALWGLPACLAGLVVGYRLSQRISTQRFEKLVYILLLLLSLLLLLPI